jgi:hypothetical protein
MRDLQPDMLRTAIGTGAIPLLQQIFPHFIACQLTLLVFRAADFRIDQRLSVELDNLNAGLSNRTTSRQAMDQRLGITDPSFNRRRQPFFAMASILQDDGERLHSIHRCTARRQELACPCGLHGISGFRVLLGTKTAFMGVSPLENQ